MLNFSLFLCLQQFTGYHVQEQMPGSFYVPAKHQLQQASVMMRGPAASGNMASHNSMYMHADSSLQNVQPMTHQGNYNVAYPFHY